MPEGQSSGDCSDGADNDGEGDACDPCPLAPAVTAGAPHPAALAGADKAGADRAGVPDKVRRVLPTCLDADPGRGLPFLA